MASLTVNSINNINLPATFNLNANIDNGLSFTYSISSTNIDSYEIYLLEDTNSAPYKVHGPISSSTTTGTVTVSKNNLLNNVMNNNYIIEDAILRFIGYNISDPVVTTDITVSKLRFIAMTNLSPTTISTGINNVIGINWTNIYKDNVTLELKYKHISNSSYVSFNPAVILPNDGYYAFSAKSLSLNTGTYTFRLQDEYDPSYYIETGSYTFTNTDQTEFDNYDYYGPQERLETSYRVAGEKAQLADEFITKSQIEPGLGLKGYWRTSDGIKPGVSGGQPVDKALAYNIVLDVDLDFLNIPKSITYNVPFSTSLWSYVEDIGFGALYSYTLNLSPLQLDSINGYIIQIIPLSSSSDELPNNVCQLYYKSHSTTQIKLYVIHKPTSIINDTFKWKIKVTKVKEINLNP